nr:immunoglobulin light chain junction region [Macaca mulatta]MOX37150.1 immunoglobulin light chain junction region [Macaca mulatta]
DYYCGSYRSGSICLF